MINRLEGNMTQNVSPRLIACGERGGSRCGGLYEGGTSVTLDPNGQGQSANGIERMNTSVQNILAPLKQGGTLNNGTVTGQMDGGFLGQMQIDIQVQKKEGDIYQFAFAAMGGTPDKFRVWEDKNHNGKVDSGDNIAITDKDYKPFESEQSYNETYNDFGNTIGTQDTTEFKKQK